MLNSVPRISISVFANTSYRQPPSPGQPLGGWQGGCGRQHSQPPHGSSDGRQWSGSWWRSGRTSAAPHSSLSSPQLSGNITRNKDLHDCCSSWNYRITNVIIKHADCRRTARNRSNSCRIHILDMWLLVVQLWNENSDSVVAQIACMRYNLVINWCSVGNQRALSAKSSLHWTAELA